MVCRRRVSSGLGYLPGHVGGHVGSRTRGGNCLSGIWVRIEDDELDGEQWLQGPGRVGACFSYWHSPELHPRSHCLPPHPAHTATPAQLRLSKLSVLAFPQDAPLPAAPSEAPVVLKREASRVGLRVCG